ncbi:MAG: GatB/YqeY domain-containing protein [Patescibacteria group bacterium]
MTLKEQIERDFIDAYKSREELKISVLRLVKSALKNEEISKKKELSEDEAVAVLKHEAKQRKDSIEEFKKADKLEAAEKEESELLIINSYLPEQLSEDDIRDIVLATKDELGISDVSQMGKLIGAVMAKHGNSVDGSLVSKIVREILQ